MYYDCCWDNLLYNHTLHIVMLYIIALEHILHMIIGWLIAVSCLWYLIDVYQFQLLCIIDILNVIVSDDTGVIEKY